MFIIRENNILNFRVLITHFPQLSTFCSAALISSTYFSLREKEFKANLRHYIILPVNTLICISNMNPLFVII